MKPPSHWAAARGDWPHAPASRFLQVGEQAWHLQQLGEGAPLLLLHGAGAASHSWAGLAALLARDFQVLVPDLPGHGFSGPAADASLPGMATAVASLLEALELSPRLLVGHSAGAAILARLCLSRRLQPAGLVSINGALMPYGGALGPLFSGAARLLASAPALPRLLAWQATRPGAVERLIRRTGSSPARAATAHYRRLVGRPAHVAATLQMMAQWDLEPLYRDLPSLATPLLLLACEGDLAVPVRQARALAARIPGSRLQVLPGLGHLGHEEQPALFAGIIRDFAAQLAIIDRVPDSPPKR